MSTHEPTTPIAPHELSTASRLAVAATYKDPCTNALYVHRDLEQVQAPWEEEAHIGPIRTIEHFGDVDSWVSYVLRYTADTDVGSDASLLPFLTWSSGGLHAVLDYHGAADEPGRCQWIAECPFVPSRQWRAWMALANGHPLGQRQAIERLEDLANDIVEPSAADLMLLLRTLRASVNAKADTDFRADGTTYVAFTKDQGVKTYANLELPPSIKVSIPVLKGHVDQDGREVRYGLWIRLRVSVGDDAHLTFRFSAPNAEQAQEEVYAERVAAAKRLLGEALPLLRAAD